MRALSPPPAVIDVVSDVVCPWCFVGQRRLASAIEIIGSPTASTAISVRWHPFELNPDLPRGGIDRRAYMEAKFGGEGRTRDIHERLRSVGESVGIAFAFDRILRQPNTRDAHRLVAWAQNQRDAGPLVDRLFRAYFEEGRDIGARDVLAAVAAEAGFDAPAAHAMLDSASGDDTVDAALRRAHALGIGGVPFFIFNGRVAVSGAQEPRVLVDAFTQSTMSPPA